jgi:hypothetical protein
VENAGHEQGKNAACLGFEKCKDSPYRSGRSPDWIKLKNPKSPAVRREAEEDWSGSRRPNLAVQRHLR